VEKGWSFSLSLRVCPTVRGEPILVAQLVVDTMKAARLTWFLLLSLVIHGLLLWQFRFIEPHKIRPFVSFKVNLASPSPPILAAPAAPKSARGPIAAAQRPASTSRRSLSSPPSAAASSSQQSSGDAAETAPGTEGTAPGAGGVLSEPGGTAIGGAGSSPGTGAAPSAGRGTPAGSGGSPSGTGDPSATDTTAISIPDSIQATTSPYEGEIYVEVDFYVLYATQARRGISVPGNQICREGDQLRTRHRFTMTETRTDLSKCHTRDYGDDVERVVCPAEALTKVVVFDGHLSSPVTYSFNICLLYDKSNCYWQDRGDDQETEKCGPAGDYPGIWAEGTMFHYNCTKSETKTYGHPLHYHVRFMRGIEFPDGRTRPRLLLRESRPIPPCK
jgi:hypothetical protein